MNAEQVFSYGSVNEHPELLTLIPDVRTHETHLRTTEMKEIGKIDMNHLEEQNAALFKGSDLIETLSTALRSQSSTSNYERADSEDYSDDSDEDEDMHFRRKRIFLAEQRALYGDSDKQEEVESLASFLSRNMSDNSMKCDSGKYVDNALNVTSDNTATVKKVHVDVRSSPPPPAKFFMPGMTTYPIMQSQNMFFQPYSVHGVQGFGYIPPPPVESISKLNMDLPVEKFSQSRIEAEDKKQVDEEIRINVTKVQVRNNDKVVSKKNMIYLFKVPRKINSMEALNAIFKKFGTIVNLHIEIRKNMAQVEFSTELEAQKAIVMSNKLKASLFSDNEIIISKNPKIDAQVGSQTKQKPMMTIEAIQNLLTAKIRELLQARSQQTDKTVFDEKITKTKDLMARIRKDPIIEKFENDLEEIGVSIAN